jgi:WhiB family redox-sensing transcriptional regulator
MRSGRGRELEGLDMLEQLLTRPRWQADGACVEHPEISWFSRAQASLAAATAVCAGCLVTAECLAFAMADDSLVGVWGGTTPEERRRARVR